MKKVLILFVIFLSAHSQSQTYLKFNTATAAILVPNIGIETSIGEKTTFSVDVMASFWESFNGHSPMKFYTLTPEIRYHFKEKYNGFYVGLHMGPDIYEIQKWNYWETNKYEHGFGYRVGATVGYNIKLNDKFLLDIFAGGGWHQGFYHGYYNDGTPGRYEKAKNWNKSGEWLPYRGGVMLSYKLN
ncbi:DUF3575 domain-containing protein [Flavobacterium sp. LC2016-23]|uniref:DUF3575 domain-containing protein n=1 Tax=Flavobacterium sp. LC2016-23 TaxID=2666330 RepID=UPI0012B11FDE|nr:DUF3575 domain-containing protein [Flavobacterium sp. LC2016-23]MRX38910.1 DUF3575 domain-containing protein [Flavobacterium sp. LC2016-23]